MYNKEFLNILENGVKPALGCTEPVAVGLAVAKAFEALDGEIEDINVGVSSNIYKNGMGVGIPGTSEIGLVFASSLAATCGDASKGLEVFSTVNLEGIKNAEKLIKEDKVDVHIDDSHKFLIDAKVKTSNGEGRCIIVDSHTNIVYVSKNEEVLFEKEFEKEEATERKAGFLSTIKLKDIIEFIENVDFEDIKFLLEGVNVNMHIANYGLENAPGAGLGAGLNKLKEQGLIEDNVLNKAKILASSACDARMAGVNLPVMSSGGSGNQGITAILPTAVVCESNNVGEEKTARALALSHLVTAYIKEFNGNLSPVCGCAIAAGIGSTASITWVMDGTYDQISSAIKNVIGTLSGLVCDGAKGGCAFKISTATTEAITQAMLAVNGVSVNGKDGILAPDVNQAIRNLGRFSKNGMSGADREIINIMEDTRKNY